MSETKKAAEARTLASGLREKRRLVSEVNKLEKRLSEALVYHEPTDGTGPVAVYSREDFFDMFERLKTKRASLFEMKRRLAVTNNLTTTEWESREVSVQELILRRGELRERLSFLTQLRERCSSMNGRYSLVNEDLKAKTFFTANELDEKVDEVVDLLCLLDNKLSQVNGTAPMKQ